MLRTAMIFTEESIQLCLESSVLVQVAIGEGPEDFELTPLKPRVASDAYLAELKARWKPGMRTVGVVGLVGASPRCALDVPIEPHQVSALMDAFLAHIHGVYCDAFAAQEVEDLQRLHRLPDVRPN
jgi:hypothetical protein